MAIKKFRVTFKSKKTIHPEGEVVKNFVVEATTKTSAVAKAKDELLDVEPLHFDMYKAGVATLIEEGEFTELEEQTDIGSEPVAEPESKPQTDSEPDSEPELVLEQEPEEKLEPVAEAEEKPQEIVQPIFECGSYDMPNFVYHASDGISSSMVKKACESLMLYHRTYISKEIVRQQSDAMKFGSLFHTLTLEPELVAEEYIVLGDIDRRTKIGRESYAAMLEKAERNHQTIVTKEQYDHAFAMSAAAVNDKYATKLLRAPNRRTEISFYDIHPTTGLQVKVRPDLIVGDICIDLKSVHINRSVDSEWMLEHLRREVLKYKYHLSAAMYLEVAKLREFVWVFVNKAPGYHWVATVKASKELLAEGEDLYHVTMHRISDAMEKDEWTPPISITPSVSNNKVILPEI